MAYIDVDKIPYYLDTSENAPMEGRMVAFKSDIDKIPTADVEEKKDCEKCIHFGKHATEYPCSHCRNCYTDKFQPNDTRTKERGGEK